MAAFVGDVVDAEVADEVVGLAERYLEGRDPLFARRIAEGRARDGHGDLLADDIFCLGDGPRVLDCLEFDEQLRFGDVLADVAFLAMDVERLGRPDLAGGFLREYRAVTGDEWPASLEHHYIAYRAQVRSLVASLRWAQGDVDSRETARRLLDLCRRHLRQGRVRFVLVGGLPGTGKSSVAREIAVRTGAKLLRSDEIRKELAGLDPLSHAPAAPDQGLYQPALTSATYAEMLTRASRLASLGESVVIDASWLHPQWRANAAGVASETSSDLVELHCNAPIEVAAERVETRMRSGHDPSDATAEVVRALAARAVPWETATVLDTSTDMSSAVTSALDAVEAAGAGPAYETGEIGTRH
jgi:predicted kinase